MGRGAPQGVHPQQQQDTMPNEVVWVISMVFCAIPSLHAPTERGQADGTCIPQRGGSGVYSACTAMFLLRLKAKTRSRGKKCPCRCEGENTTAGVTQAWLYDGPKQSCYVKAYSQTPIVKSADHISNVYYNSLIVWITYLKTTYTLLFIREWLQKKSQVSAAGQTSCFFSIKWGHIIFLWDTFGTGAI